MHQHHAVLTVGSTEFTALVHAFLELRSLSALASLGIRTVMAQVGDSALPAGWKEGKHVMQELKLEVEVVRFSADLEIRVGQAQLVVSHAGAGSILSFVRPVDSATLASGPSSSTPRPRQLVLVPNSSLMDSHQADLADEFKTKGWARVCDSVEHLATALEAMSANSAGHCPTSLPEFAPHKIARILDETLGYA